MLNLATQNSPWQVTGIRDGFENEKVIVDLDNDVNMINNDGLENQSKVASANSTNGKNQLSAVSLKRAAMNERVKKIMEKQQAARLKKKGK